MSAKNKAHFLAKKEAIHLILTGIGDDIYSTVDACQTLQEMWEAIERVQQGESLNIHDVKTNLFWEFGKFTSHDGESMESYYTRFYKLMNEIIRNNLIVTTMQIYKPINNNLRTFSNSKNKNVDMTPRYKNDNHSGQFRTQRTVNVAGIREKNVEKDTDKKVDEQELEAHYSYMAKIQEVPNADSGADFEPVEQNDQNDEESNDERVALANLIANLKLDVDENKKIQKQLKKANTTLAQEIKECKAIIAETCKSLGEYISVRDSCLVALQTKQTEFEKYTAFNNRTVDYDKLKRKLNEALGQIAHKDTVKENSKKDKIKSKQDKNGKRGEAEKSQKQLQ
nr:hypothetical protein [Tanacetum cinerariifolium]